MEDFLFLALIMFVYSGLGDSNPEMMAKLICPMVLLIIIGVVGMAVVAAIVGRFLKISPYLGFVTVTITSVLLAGFFVKLF